MRELKFRIWDSKNKRFIDGIPTFENIIGNIFENPDLLK